MVSAPWTRACLAFPSLRAPGGETGSAGVAEALGINCMAPCRKIQRVGPPPAQQS
jgi:hypothetical protein